MALKLKKSGHIVMEIWQEKVYIGEMKANNYNITLVHGDLPADATFPNGNAAVDTETLGLNLNRDRLCLLQISNGEGDVWLVKFDGENWNCPNLRKVLENKNITKIFHFARFDVAVIKKYLQINTFPVYCTKIVSKLTRTYTDKHGLKGLVGEIIGIAMDKEQQSSYWAAEELSEAQKHYAASDVIYLHELKENLDKRLKELGREDIANECFKFLPARAELDLMGWDEKDIFSHMS